MQATTTQQQAQTTMARVQPVAVKPQAIGYHKGWTTCLAPDGGTYRVRSI